MPRNDTGINNSKAYLNEYARSLRTQTPSASRPVSILPLCEMLLQKMGEGAYFLWLETAPDEDAAFDDAVRAKFKEITIGRS